MKNIGVAQMHLVPPPKCCITTDFDCSAVDPEAMRARGIIVLVKSN